MRTRPRRAVRKNQTLLGDWPMPEVRIETDQISAVLVNEVIKREVMEGEKAEEARRKISRVAGKALRASSKDDSKDDGDNEKTATEPPSTAAAPA